MTRVHNFTCDLARAGKSVREIMATVEEAYPGEGLSLSQVYRLIKTVKEGKDDKDKRGKDNTKTIRKANLIQAVKADVEDDRRVTAQQLAEWHSVSHGTIISVLHKDLGLSKKSARWVPKLLSDEQKQKRLECSQAFVNRYMREGTTFLDKIVTMDESAVAYHTPETKNQSTVNANYIIEALKMFINRMHRKRPEKWAAGIILHWDNAPVHTAHSVTEFLATKKNIEVTQVFQILESGNSQK